MKSAVIIGSGISGLATAIRLASAGFQVRVLEKNGTPGGKISELHSSGFRFDTGPSLFTMPEFVEELFLLAGKDPRNYLTYSKLSTVCRYFYENGSRINAFQDLHKFAEEIEHKTLDTRERLIAYLQKASDIYAISADVFIHKPFHKWSNLCNPQYLSALFKFPEIDAFRTMHARNSQWFKDPRLVQIFDRYATYVGSDPFKAPATLNMIAHLEHIRGAYLPDKGMYRIITALFELAREMGVMFDFHTEVKQLLLKDHQVTGLITTKGRYTFDVVVSDIDVHSLKEKLYERTPPRLRSRNKYASSALVFYWGIHASFPFLDMHNILFSADYQQEFRHIFDLHSVYEDPTVYIFISSKYVPGDAPEGNENWFAMINVPPYWGQDAGTIRRARKNIIHKINRMLNINIEKHIATEHVLTPSGIDERTASAGGALYGINANGKFAAFNRHPNHLRKFKNLFFTGGSVHPGGGIPLCLSSAKIISHEILKKYSA